MKKQLQILAKNQRLSGEQTEEVFAHLLDPSSEITDAQIGAYLFATAIQAPSSEDLLAGAKQLRAHMKSFDSGTSLELLDTCGTGGSGYSTFNTSTAVAFVCAACGQAVAKHGNRAASSKCGSADILEQLGLELDLDTSALARQLNEHGFVFLFAPMHHFAAKRVALLRKELGLRTIFNFLGPLANPANVDFQLLGVSNKQAQKPMAEALSTLGVKRALVVRSQDGLDELSCSAINDVIEVNGSSIKEYELDPQSLGLAKFEISDIEIHSLRDAVNAMNSVLNGEASAYREIVVLNSAAALYISKKVDSIELGLERAREALDSGDARRVLERLVDGGK